MLRGVYAPSDFPPFAVTVDLVVLTVRADALCALLVRRGEAPFLGRWALPGGFVQVAESVDAAAGRELVEETGVAGLHLEQLATYGEPRRDPRMRVVSVAYLALAPDLPVPVAGTDAAAAAWVPVSEVSSLAFDHSRILADGVERARAKLEYSSLGTAFCGGEFTVAELRRVYEIVWGVGLDPRNFHRKVTGVEGFLVPTGGTTSRDGGRPAALYRRGEVGVLSPPLVRSSA
ncbi:NUDIX hydrolase [Lentzea flaviverrucosa]|uniref:8-oxo-dGTP diphosphatase n=1 Tax=Lentzea flaviverrucosa TaxID=200379 RepID=A0A1H9U8T6_9PSEU|nr:NUDIX domain-containing protein [Lentzea flaviverrucosa]RDI33247.1 8-oxo-dGTP diphosphatase [Lentzea flaviverrucosa]SES05749.1 8-oxo-dGTP diphosphatase [Lentzea flaviverrucosa]